MQILPPFFLGDRKNAQNEQTEPNQSFCFDLGTRRRTKVRREAKFVYSKKALFQAVLHINVNFKVLKGSFRALQPEETLSLFVFCGLHFFTAPKNYF